MSILNAITKHENTDVVVSKRLAVRTVRKLGGKLSEAGETVDGEVLLIRVARVDNVLCLYQFQSMSSVSRGDKKEWDPHLLHAGKHVGLSLTVTVRADAKVNFAWVLVGLEGLSDACIRRMFSMKNLCQDCSQSDPRLH